MCTNNLAIAADNAAVSHFGISGRFYITTWEFILSMVVFKKFLLPLHCVLGLLGSINITQCAAEDDRRGRCRVAARVDHVSMRVAFVCLFRIINYKFCNCL